MKTLAPLLLSALLPLTSAAGEPIFENSFDSPAEQALFTPVPAAAWKPAGDGFQLKISATKRNAANSTKTKLDLRPWRGMDVLVSCRVKAENVSQPAASHNGVKLMLYYQTPSTGKQWPGARLPAGSFDWKTAAFRTSLPDDIGDAELVLGLQDSTGTVLFDNLSITPGRYQRVRHPAPAKNPPPVSKGHTLPRLRGVMSGSKLEESDIRHLAENWGGNLIRFQINRNWHLANDNRDLAEYHRWVDSQLDLLEQVLVHCRKYGIHVAVDLHALPGGRYENRSMAMFYEQAYADSFVRVWEKIARRFKGEPVIWAYDLVNEPVHADPQPVGMADFRELQLRAAKAIRRIDPGKPIIFEVFKWDSPEGFRYMTPVDLPGIIYQSHMYLPFAFTHQGVGAPAAGTRYPGVVDGRAHDKSTLREYLQPVRDFQLAYNVPIYLGEFSAARWAPGAETYLNDVISIFEEYDWDWSYHAYREAQCWSLEHTEDPDRVEAAESPTDRLRVLKSWFSKNQRATFQSP